MIFFAAAQLNEANILFKIAFHSMKYYIKKMQT